MGGAVLVLSTSYSPASLDAGLGMMGLDIRLASPNYDADYRRRPVADGFCENLARFLWLAASAFDPQDLFFHDEQAGLTLSVLDAADFTVTLQVEVVALEGEQDDDIDGLNFETARAVLVSASEQARGLASRGEVASAEWTAPRLPLELFPVPGASRLTGIYRLRGVHNDASEALIVSHLIGLGRDAVGEVETSAIASFLPFSCVAAHGVDAVGDAWALVTQVLPLSAETALAAPWDAEAVAREEVRVALMSLGSGEILSESTANTRQQIALLNARGVDYALLADWSSEELALAGIAELTNVPLTEVAVGRVTGCVLPDVAHDCPRDVYDCAFGRWQDLNFSRDREGEG